MTTAINTERGDIMEMEDTCPPLIDILSEIPDYRKAKGKRHPLSAILALACVAMMCGYKGYRAFAEWRGNYGDDLMKVLGFTRLDGPCYSTFSNIFRGINVKLFEKKEMSHPSPSPLGSNSQIYPKGGQLSSEKILFLPTFISNNPVIPACLAKFPFK